MQQLLRVVPLVDGLGGVDALVALEAYERSTRPGGEGLGDLGLADAGLALEQDRTTQPQGEEDRRGEPLVSEVTLVGQCSNDVVDRRNLVQRNW